MRWKLKTAAVITPLILGACTAPVLPVNYSARDAGFAAVEARTSKAIGKRTVWAQSQAETVAASKQVRAMVQGKTISAETAVQVALLNNKGLQASYAQIGLSAAEAWQQSTPENPVVSIGLLGIGAPEVGLYRALESMIAVNLLDARTRKQRIAAAEAEEVDAFYSMEGEYIDVMSTLDGWIENEIATAATIVIRPNQLAEIDGMKPYEDKRVRNALQLAVDNAVLLELGYAGRGIVAENHHVGPMHPEYAEVEPPKTDPEAARALMEEAGMADYEHELFSIDDAWRKDTTDAVAAQLRDAGIKVKRTILPGSTFWNDWVKYPFSSTNWNARPLGVQIWALAYRSGEAWNEFGYANPEFDALLSEALATADVDARREIMARGEKMLQDDGVTIQPYWRSLYNHTREGLVGAAHHIGFEYHPARMAWAEE